MEGDDMNPNEFLQYLWDSPQTKALAESLAMVLVGRGRLDLVRIPVETSAPKRLAG
jgi:hypothetical protein